MSNNKIVFIAIIIIIISFVLPATLIKQDKNTFGIAIYKEMPQRTVNANIRNIYLVKAIHEIEKATEKVLVSPKAKQDITYVSYGQENNLEKEIQNLVSYDIINDKLEKNSDYTMSIAPKYLMNNDTNYVINEFFITLDELEYRFEIEEKSGKILSMYVDKDIINSKLPKEEMLMKYVKYLGLEIIDDWKYEDGWLKSDKADLVTAFIESEKENKCIISLHSKKFLEN